MRNLINVLAFRRQADHSKAAQCWIVSPGFRLTSSMLWRKIEALERKADEVVLLESRAELAESERDALLEVGTLDLPMLRSRCP